MIYEVKLRCDSVIHHTPVHFLGNC